MEQLFHGILHEIMTLQRIKAQVNCREMHNMQWKDYNTSTKFKY